MNKTTKTKTNTPRKRTSLEQKLRDAVAVSEKIRAENEHAAYVEEEEKRQKKDADAFDASLEQVYRANLKMDQEAREMRDRTNEHVAEEKPSLIQRFKNWLNNK